MRVLSRDSHQSFSRRRKARKTSNSKGSTPPAGNMKAKFLLLHFVHVVVAGAAVKHLLQMKLFIKLKLFKNYVKYVLRGSFIFLLPSSLSLALVSLCDLSFVLQNVLHKN